MTYREERAAIIEFSLKPTPGTLQSIRKHGYPADIIRQINAVGRGKKPVMIGDMSEFMTASEAGIGRIERRMLLSKRGLSFTKAPFDGTKRGFIIHKDNMPAAQRAFDAVRHGDYIDKGKALGYTDHEIKRFIQRSNALDARH